MYPEKLGVEHSYWFGNEYFFDLKSVHTYMHNNYTNKMHAHQFYEINIIMKGEGRHYIADTSLPAKVGDVFVIPPEIPHGYYSEEKLDIYHILIKSDFFTRYREELEQISGFNLLFDIEPLIRQSSGKAYNLNVGLKELDVIKNELKNINDVENRGQFIYLNILTLSFICRLSILLEDRIKHTNTENRNSNEILRIMDYIQNNLGQKLSLKEIAEYGNMSTATLNRRFREMLNTSPMEYVMYCRITKAKGLLEQKEHNKAEIAQMCGFYDSVHLNKYLARYKNSQ